MLCTPENPGNERRPAPGVGAGRRHPLLAELHSAGGPGEAPGHGRKSSSRLPEVVGEQVLARQPRCHICSIVESIV
ncbi:hypothetical protein GCM10012320_23620 [Sinomonas cellulolyticus]|nr:hypothetical protein GCM10012320_23620 [Sinomonas sp. KCTC 49339]